MTKLKRVIFLDIDGVLQRDDNRERFNNDLFKLREELADKYKNDDYLKWDRYDLGAVYYDWDVKAVERLRRLCIDVPAEIVLSSDWRRYSPLSRLKDYFRIHDLDRYLTDVIPLIEGKRRCGEIEEYLKKHPDIEKFVILDDYHVSDFEEHYPEQFVYCRYVFTEECYKKALGILTKE